MGRESSGGGVCSARRSALCGPRRPLRAAAPAPYRCPMPTYLITGANRGLGLEFARQLSARKDETRIIATAREVEKATELARLVHGVLPLDVAEAASIARLQDL